MRLASRGAPLIALPAIGWGANQFAPLVVMYQQLGIDATAAQTMFVLYAVGLVPGLFAGGPISDRYGRRIVVLAALVASGVSTVLLMVGGTSAPLLYVGRLLAGLASGAGFSAGTAWAKESAPGPHGARRAVIAMTAGFGLGPLVAGLVAAVASPPEVIAYVPHLVITAVAVLVVAASAASAPAHDSSVPVGDSSIAAFVRDPRFVRVIVPLAPWVFLTASVALAVLPGAVARPGSGVLFSALVTPIPAISGILVQSLMRPLAGDLRRQLLVGFAFTAVGFAVGAWAVAAGSLVGVIIAAVLLGCAYGMCQTAGLAEVAAMSPANRLGRTTAIYQALTYLGYLAPLPIVVLARWVPLPAILIALTVLAALTAVATTTHLRKVPA
ncbi:MFS transporter [Epidermidibacterium keratini]|uniref:MFS transporter n=1 Tax=Epidermidibacterium keratini TaxID=1891644 RepID=A0A7L4YMG2_9ACTN|nr:MFS transporter [Epidermidibacterium keratini]QHC00465.1 MFS transporter [Epidermidibacterium keratini]